MHATRRTSRKAASAAIGVGLAVSALTFATATPASAADPVEVQVLATNDFHGRILPNGAEAGAAVLSGAVKQLQEENPNTVFAAAGDLIGASTFESFIQRDKPTIDALNAAGLDVSAVGNHELDRGYTDLVDRVMAPESDANPEGGAAWEYVAANLEETEDNIAESWTTSFGTGEDAVEIGFVGAVTEELPSLVSPAGIAGHLTVEDIVTSVNAEAAALKAGGADAIVMLVHEGSPSESCSSTSFTDEGTVWGNIVQNVSPEVDAIVSGHTHLAYDCKIAIGGVAGTERPVVSAGQYGVSLNQLNLTIDADTGVTGVETAILPLMGEDPDGKGPEVRPALYPADPVVESIVTAAAEEASVLGSVPIGKLAAPLSRAKYTNGTENRGSSSTLGNLVAEVQRWATPAERDAQIAFMNPGGLRGDMVGTVVDEAWLGDPDNAEWADDYAVGDRVLTYAQAAGVQSFANSLINMDLTGAQIKTVLEQQWQRNSEGEVPTRAFLRLGVSDGFTYTYDEVDDPEVDGARKGIITGMWLDGVPIDPEATYSVTVNSFLASGGDNFRALADGTDRTDWGMTDLESMVEYFEAFGQGTSAIPVSYDQRAVEVSFPGSATAAAGGPVVFDVAAWSMTGSAGSPAVDDVTDDELQVKLGADVLGSFPVTTDPGEAADNNTTRNGSGTASVDVVLPTALEAGVHDLTLVGPDTGTVIPVLITVTKSAGCTNAEAGLAQAQASLAKAKAKKQATKKKLRKAKKADSSAKKVKRLQKKLAKAKRKVSKTRTGLENAQANVGKHC